MSKTTVAKVAKDISSYGDTRGTNLYWRDPKDQVGNALVKPTGKSRSTSLPGNSNDKWRKKAIDLYHPSMEPDSWESPNNSTKQVENVNCVKFIGF